MPQPATHSSELARLRISDLCVTYCGPATRSPVVRRVSLEVPAGKTVALVGESGCGKSTVALAAARLIPPSAGCHISGSVEITSREPPVTRDILRLRERELQQVRGKQIATVFQDPLSALNPVLSIGAQVGEAVRLHCGLRGATCRERVVELLRNVGIANPAQRARDFPHQFSGGMRQRVMIATAIAGHPDVLIADEPTTALDVITQAQVLALLRQIQQASGMSILFITHDLGIVSTIADYVYVMYAGRIVEHGDTQTILKQPFHPYTRDLLECVPRTRGRERRLATIRGQVPSPEALPTGCTYHPRCSLTADLAAKTQGDDDVYGIPGGSVLTRCVTPDSADGSGEPELQEISDGHFAACPEVRGAASAMRLTGQT